MMKRFGESVLLCVVIGAGIAGMLGALNTAGILVDEYITATLTITDLQTGVVLLWFLIGVIYGVMRR